MALNPIAFARLIDQLQPGQAIASMGYPDIIYPPDMLREKLGDKVLQVKYRPDSAEICRRHGLKYREVPDAESLFDVFGCSLDVFDIVAERGGEIVLDLNHPFPAGVCEQYDYVLDVGTLEHCFNVARALMNMAAMVKVGGVIIHDNPLNWGNHGFYGINPTLYGDFYTDNGFEILECRLTDKSARSFPIDPYKRFTYIEQEVDTFVIARRLEVKEFIFPTQRKYRPKHGKDRGEDRNGSSAERSERWAGGLQHAAPPQG